MFQIRTERALYDFGTILHISDDLTKSVTPVPIPSLPTDSTYALETNTSNKFTITFERKNPLRFVNGDYESYEGDVDYYNLSWKWTNALWSDAVMSLLNRWQIRTDGYKMYINADEVQLNKIKGYSSVSNLFPTHQGVNVYVEDIKIKLSEGQTEVLTGTITVVVGGRLAEKLSADTTNDAILVKQFNQSQMDEGYHLSGEGRYIPLFLERDEYEELIINNTGQKDIWCYNSHNEYNDGIESAKSTIFLTVKSATQDNVTLTVPLMIGKPYALDNTERHDWEYDYTNTLDIVSSYTLSGGPEEPFEKLVLKMSRRVFARTYPEVDMAVSDMYTTNVDEYRYKISPKESVIQITAIGRGTYIVDTCSLNDNVYTITAYCPASRLTEGHLSNATAIWNSPLTAILDILTNESYGLGGYIFEPSRIICNAKDITGFDLLGQPNNSYVDINKVPKEYRYLMDNVGSKGAWSIITDSKPSPWEFIQRCALLINAKVFFANNRAYIIDYTRLDEISEADYPSTSGPSGGITPYHSANRLVQRCGLDRGLFPVHANARGKLTPWGLDLDAEGALDSLNELNSVELHTECSLDRVQGRIYGTVSQPRDTTVINTVTVIYNSLKVTEGTPAITKAESFVKKLAVGQIGKDSNQFTGELVCVSQDKDGADIFEPSPMERVDREFNRTYTTYKGINLEQAYKEIRERAIRSIADTGAVNEYTLDLTAYFTYLPDQYARRAAYSILDYYSESRRPIQFTVNERCSGSISEDSTGYGESYWSPVFPIVSSARQFTDIEQEMNTNAISKYISGKYLPQLLSLSVYSRDYPSGRTTYTFGSANTIGLDNTLSSMNTTGNR